MPFAGEPSPLSSDPTALCAGYLDWYATVLLRRLEGLSDAQVRTPAVPSGWSLLGLVQHSACVRRFWVRHVFSGEDVDFSWPGTAEQEWVPRPEDTVAGVSAFYRSEHENSLRVLRSHDAVPRRGHHRGARLRRHRNTPHPGVDRVPPAAGVGAARRPRRRRPGTARRGDRARPLTPQR